MKTLELAKQFMQAAGNADEIAARACLHPDCEIWHNYDNVTQTVDENMALMMRMKAAASDRRYEIHLLEEVTGGYVQRHTLHITSLDGQTTFQAEALSLITVNNGLITRIEEFIDPSPIMPLFTQGGTNEATK